MLKLTLTTLICLTLAGMASAQRDTSVYYLKKTVPTVTTKDDLDYFEQVYPSKAAADSGLFVVRQFYKNGKIRSEGLSKTNSAYPRLQGIYTNYFANGNKMTVRHYTDGKQDGEETGYYPNGKFYYSKTYSAGKQLFNEYRDSTGNVLAKNGNGKWTEFTGDNFGDDIFEGQVVNGQQEGEWRRKIHDTLSVVTKFKNGEQKWSYHIGPDGQATYWMVETLPVFPGGMNGLYRFLAQNIRYPVVARQNNIQGRVIITFIVDTDGKLTDVRVVRGVGGGCDEEALRVLRASPQWSPGLVENKPVRVQYSVPISFTLGK